jgi:hypothetical protein
MGKDPFADEAVGEYFSVVGKAWKRRASSARCGKLACIYTRGLLDVKRDFCGSGADRASRIVKIRARGPGPAAFLDCEA